MYYFGIHNSDIYFSSEVAYRSLGNYDYSLLTNINNIFYRKSTFRDNLVLIGSHIQKTQRASTSF